MVNPRTKHPHISYIMSYIYISIYWDDIYIYVIFFHYNYYTTIYTYILYILYNIYAILSRKSPSPWSPGSARSSTICCLRAAFTSTATPRTPKAACLGRQWRAAKLCHGRSRQGPVGGAARLEMDMETMEKWWKNGDFTKKNIETWGISEDLADLW